MVDNSWDLENYINEKIAYKNPYRDIKMHKLFDELKNIGYMGFDKFIKNNRFPEDVSKLLKMSKNSETPFPDLTREYDEKSGEGIDSVGLGLIKK